jgi:hypothetical protein
MKSDSIRASKLHPPLFITLIFVLGIFSAGQSYAEVIVYEGFDYAEGTDLKGQGGGLGWKDKWFGSAAGGVVISKPVKEVAGLPVAGLAGTLKGNDVRVFRTIDTDRPELAKWVDDSPSGKMLGKDGTTIWISFFISCTSYPKLAHGGVHLMEGVQLGPTYKKTQRIQLGRQNNDSHWFLGRVDQGGPAAGTWHGTVTSDKTVRLLVYRFDFKPGKGEGWMWVDPARGVAPDPAKADIHAAAIAPFHFNAVNLGSGGGATFFFDELRIGTSYADVVPEEKRGK